MRTSPRTDQDTRRDWLAFGRSDRIGLVALLVAVVLGAAVTWLVVPLMGWVRGRALAIPFTSAVDVPGLDGTGLRWRDASYDLLVDDPTTRQRVLDLLPGLGYLLLVVAACWLVLRLIGDIGRDDPFPAHNVRRLRALAALLALGWPVAFFAEVTCRFVILTGLDLGDLGPRASFTIPVVAIVTGTAVALLAEAFKAGSRLRDDVDGLV
ncbi:MAG: DUF2975 domain-containing protein [Nocardioidaceae bacterium]